jgi:hypothetical protein
LAPNWHTLSNMSDASLPAACPQPRGTDRHACRAGQAAGLQRGQGRQDPGQQLRSQKSSQHCPCSAAQHLLDLVGQEQQEKLREVLLWSNYGSLLGYRPETLALHFEQLHSVLGASRQDVINAVLKAPSVVSV